LLASAFLANDWHFAKETTLGNLAILLFEGCKVSIVANFWVFVLSQNDMIFGWIRRFFSNLGEKYYLQESGINQERLATFNDFMKPIFTCEICVGCNIGFWIYLVLHQNEFIIFDLFYLLSATTLITAITKETWQKLAVN
jgi:hypothetical protein